MSADLHCHTRLSNGSLGIEDLILLAKKRNIGTIAITDLDCLAGTVRGKIIGERAGIRVITGVELSATDKTFLYAGYDIGRDRSRDIFLKN